MEIFKKYDKDQGGTMDRAEFNAMMKDFAPGLKNYETDAVFDKFDFNKDGQIQFHEFYQHFTQTIRQEFVDQTEASVLMILNDIQKFTKEYKIDFFDEYK